MKIRIRHIGAILTLALIAPCSALAQQATTASSSASQLQQQIDAHNAQISALDTQIAQYQTQLDATSEKKQTLQTTLNQLDLSIKKTNASISVAKDQIGATQLQLQQLGIGINDAQNSISDGSAGLAQSIRTLAEEESEPLAVQILSDGTLSNVWNDVTTSESLQFAIGQNLQTLNQAKQTLTNTQTQTQQKNVQLVQQKTALLTQQGSLSATQQAQSQLLTQTKSQESTYEALIAQKKSQEATFESELTDLKSQYNQAVNPSEITPPGAGILQWPIAGTIRITQYFGDTPFAQSNPTLYSGHGHDGLDIAAPIGTPVHAALAGTILATGNTDATKGCQGGSFGKWVMIEHNNGINTMYAHLSQIGVIPGQQVTTGQVIGYSGETGYATGPHLHFGVYVSSVTKIIPLGQATGGTAPCSKAIMPVPPVSGYLNPLNYLPTISGAAASSYQSSL